MSSNEIKKLEGMFNRVIKEEQSSEILKKVEDKSRKQGQRKGTPHVTTGKIFSRPKKYSRLLEMRQNLAKAKEIRRKLKQKEEETEEEEELDEELEDEEFKSITTASSDSNDSEESAGFKPMLLEDSDEELLKTLERTQNPEHIPINQSLNDFVGVDGLPITKDLPVLLPGELPQNPDGFFQELENNDAFYRDVFEQTPSQNMGEILTPIISDYEEPPIDMDLLFDLALIETDEQIYEENHLRHTMALAVFEDKNIEELKELLETIKKQPL